MSTSNNTHANSVTSATSSSNNHPHPASRSSGSATTGGPGGGGGGRNGASSTSSSPTKACAACKYQRRKCNPDCTMAPYFPADAQRQFLNAHRLFGVKNILNTLRELDPSQRPAAMNTIMIQSNVRAQDPVGGCYRIILELQRQIDRDSTELELVLRQLALCRAAQAQTTTTQMQPPPPPPQQHYHQQSSTLPELNISPTINLMDHNINIDDTTTIDGDDLAAMPTMQQQHQQHQYLYYYFGGTEECDGNENNNNSDMIIKDRSAEVEPPPASPLIINSGCGVGQPLQRQQCEDDVIKQPVNSFDVRHHRMFLTDQEDDSKNPPLLDYSNTARLDLKEEPNSLEQVQEHDLKSAASLFKLTNYDMSSV